jgi:type II secretory pathway pseudopilin PulG
MFSIDMKRERAYTLFEVLIVLALLTVVLMLVSLAVDIHLRQMVINRTEVEEAQLARTVLEKIAHDIRSVVVSVRNEQLEVDTALLAIAMGLATDSVLTTETATEETETETEETVIYGEIPGIYGGLDWIQIDTARLPRGEMYGSRQVRRGTSAASDRLSPSKTVLYYLGSETGQLTLDDPRYQSEQLIGSIGRPFDPNAVRYGLFRRQLDRQVMQYAIQEGRETEDEQYDEPMVPEVEWIEFAYFDPTAAQTGTTGEWIESWDMDDRRMLPTAIRITAAIRRPDFGRGLLSSWTATSENVQPVIYSLVVPIPVHIDVPSEEEESTESSETEMY